MNQESRNSIIKNDTFSIYIHFPFCIKKCNYCDFVSYKFARYNTDQYLDCLIKEIALFSEINDVQSVVIDTIYFGGGTPSLLKEKQIEQIFNVLNSHFDLSKVREITLEANPETVYKEKFAKFRSAGFNRVSLGAQSFNDKTLKTLGRIHDSKRIYQAFSALRDAGFENINLDLMFALPGETLKDIIKSLRETVSLHPEHISFYSLTIEKGTNFYRNKSKLNLPNEGEEYLQYKSGIEFLENNGYKQYEISNFAIGNFQSIHNLHYWKNLPYFGFGISAASFLRRYRSQNYFRMKSYCDSVNSGKLPVRYTEHLRALHARAEHIMLGLRTLKGIDKYLYYVRFGTLPEHDFGDVIKKLKKEHLIKENEHYIFLTKKGLFIANSVFEEFLP